MRPPQAAEAAAQGRRRLLKAALGAVCALPLLPSPPARAHEPAGPFGVTEAAWRADGLAGTLALPVDGPARGLGILIVAGSGPTDRDGNGPGLTTDLYRKLAAGLAGAGYRVLRYDKRGIAGSRALAPREEDMRFGQMVDDAGIAAAALAARPDVSAVVLLGHSEGALVATFLAGRGPFAGLVLLAGPGRALATVLEAQLEAAPLPDPLRAEALRILAALAADQPVPDVPPALAALFRPSVQPYLMSQLTIDPAAALAATTVPTLLIGAGRDLQVGDDDLARLAAARRDAGVVRLPEANHVFAVAPEDRAGNIALYARPQAPLDPGLLPPLLDFLVGLR